MSFAARAVMIGVPLLLLLLTAIASYAYSQIISLYLPIPNSLGLFTILLPLITGLTTRLTRNLLHSSKTEQSQLTIPLLFILGFQLIYETIIITLSLTKIIPPTSLTCGLKDQWMTLFGAKNEDAIRAIQDRFNCCGLMTIKDNGWPFPGKNHDALSCSRTFGRTKACFGDWRQAQQINAGLFLLVAIVVFMVKLTVILFLTTNSSWSNDGAWIRSFGHGGRRGREDRHGRRVVGFIDGGESAARAGDRSEGGEVEVYRDDVDGDERQDVGPLVVPSAIGAAEGENIWREGNAVHTREAA